MDSFRRALLVASFLLSQGQVLGEFPLTLNLSTTQPEEVTVGSEIFLSCSSNDSIVSQLPTLTINGQSIGGFSGDFLLNDFSLQFGNVELNADNDQRVAQCHIGTDLHSNPYVIDIVNVENDFALTLSASDESVVESDSLNITCTVTNGATGMVILRIDGDPIMNSAVMDPTQAVTFVVRFTRDGCFMAQCTLEQGGSNPQVIIVCEVGKYYCPSEERCVSPCDHQCQIPGPEWPTDDEVCTECSRQPYENFCLSNLMYVSRCESETIPCSRSCNSAGDICDVCACSSQNEYFCKTSLQCQSLDALCETCREPCIDLERCADLMTTTTEGQDHTAAAAAGGAAAAAAAGAGGAAAGVCCCCYLKKKKKDEKDKDEKDKDEKDDHPEATFKLNKKIEKP